MTVQTLEQKRRKKKQSVDEIFDWAREQFVKAEELYHKRKRDVILEVTRRLEEADFEQNKISQEITHRLDGLIDASYVHKVLTDFPQYKEEYRVRNAEKRNFSRNIPAKPTQFKPSDSSVCTESKEEPQQQQSDTLNSQQLHSPTTEQPESQELGPQMQQPDEAALASDTELTNEQPQEFIVNYHTVDEIDSYDEQYCKQVLKEIIPIYLKQRSLESELKTEREHNRKLSSELDKLKFKYNLCILWPRCKNKGTYKQHYNGYTDSESWLCDKHRRRLEGAEGLFSKILSG